MNNKFDQSNSFSDVRGRGFYKRHSVDVVCRWLDTLAMEQRSCIERVDRAESVDLDQSVSRRLARAIASPIRLPEFDRAMMDGYAVKAEDVSGAAANNPIELIVRGKSLPGRPSEIKIDSGSALSITTGAAMPPGADAVIPFEWVRQHPNSQLVEAGQKIEVTTDIPPQKHVALAGEDVTCGDLLFPENHCVRPVDLCLLSAISVLELQVFPRPQVSILITGNEVVAPGSEKTTFQVYDSNRGMLENLVARDGGQPSLVRYVADDAAELRAAIETCASDLILLTGGSSVGPEDFVPATIHELGQLRYHGMAMRPSSPAGVGLVGDSAVFLLPGNPVSCLCAYEFFAGRYLRQLAGGTADWPHPRLRARLADNAKIASALGRLDYCRVQLDGELVRPLAIGGASVLTSLTRADGFVLVEENSEGHGPGEEVAVFLY